MDICLDCDGTIVTHEYPLMGKDIGAQKVLKKLVKKGHNLILFTMRSGDQLDDAIQWFKDNKIRLYASQYNPGQSNWTKSNKCYAQLYIDDAGIGCPLVYQEHDRPYADWKQIEKLLKQQGIL